jgi:hypothetical protein
LSPPPSGQHNEPDSSVEWWIVIVIIIPITALVVYAATRRKPAPKPAGYAPPQQQVPGGRVQGPGFGGQGSGFRGQGSGFSGQGPGFGGQRPFVPQGSGFSGQGASQQPFVPPPPHAQSGYAQHTPPPTNAPIGYTPYAPPHAPPPVYAPQPTGAQPAGVQPGGAPPTVYAPQPIRAPSPSGIVADPTLTCTRGHFAGTAFPLQGKTLIGRDPARCQIVYPADARGVSSVHCEVFASDLGIWLTDRGSTYGTFLTGGRKLNANESVKINVGDGFYLADGSNEFRVGG